MASLLSQRRPLTNRSLQNPSHPSPSKPTRTVSGSKRPRSPEHGDPQTLHTKKRVKATPPTTTSASRDLHKEKKHGEREQKEAEFREKYTCAFPGWKFYLDSESLGGSAVQIFRSRILHLGGKIEEFFSVEATHLVTNRQAPPNSNPDKENDQNIKPAATRNLHALKSPIKLIHRGEDTTACNLVNKAHEYGMKIWNTTKLDSVLSRCLLESSTKSTSGTLFAGASLSAPQRSLSRLLQTEKIHGTSERDPTQKRHDYHYFTRGSCFVLLEDMNQELATIAAHEYPIVKNWEKPDKKPWPVLYCHPHSRNPFAAFDDKEKKRWERLQQAEKLEEAEHASRKKRQLQIAALKRKAETNVGRNDDLRRSVSLSNLHRRLSHPIGRQLDGCIDLDADGDDNDSANASGYLASGAGMGYIAASGNSVSVTSMTGTTSTSTSGHGLRNLRLSASMAERMKQHVVTSRKFSVKEKVVDGSPIMGPPSKVPSKQLMLRKSKSMNTLKLPKREEGVKPGYCESCRVKFSDFSTHLESKKHRKFASDPANFEALDFVLNRIRRRTRQEVEAQERQRTLQYHSRSIAHQRHSNLDMTRRLQELSPL